MAPGLSRILPRAVRGGGGRSIPRARVPPAGWGGERAGAGAAEQPDETDRRQDGERKEERGEKNIFMDG